MVRVRFAPSPTGRLHLGSGRTALFNYLFAKHHHGTFVLRIDDTDKERSKPEFEEDIKTYMRWLGLDWDEGPERGGDFGPYYQSERIQRHRDAAYRLLDEGKAFRDSDGTIRLSYPSQLIVVEDLICGTCNFGPESLGPEPVILRADGTPTYHLATVVDDIDMGITHIIRGQDHLTNTAKHQIMFDALSGSAPCFAHLPLILGEDGSKLSKRNSGGLVSVGEFAEKGYLPEALVNFLILLGWSHPDGLEHISLDEGVKSFTLDRVKGTSGAKFELQKLNWLNGWWLRSLPLDRAAHDLLQFAGDYRESLDSRGKKWWIRSVESLRDSLALLTDVRSLASLLCDDKCELTQEAQDLLTSEEVRLFALAIITEWRKIIHELELEDGMDSLSEAQFSKTLAVIKKSVDCKPKIVFQALRIAVTGAISGPELKDLVPLIPRQILVERARLTIDQITCLKLPGGCDVCN